MRAREHGGALLVTLLLTVGLIAGGAVLFRMQLFSSRAAGLVTEEIGAQNCAEAGLIAARPMIASNFAIWNGALCNPTPPRGTGACVIGSAAAEPSWLSAIPHDIDGDSTNDITIALVDNDDESPSDLTQDTDATVHIIATCNLRGTRAQIDELVHYDSATTSLTRKMWIRTE